MNEWRKNDVHAHRTAINRKSYAYAHTHSLTSDDICIYANERNLNIYVVVYGMLISAQMHILSVSTISQCKSSDDQSTWDIWNNVQIKCIENQLQIRNPILHNINADFRSDSAAFLSITWDATSYITSTHALCVKRSHKRCQWCVDELSKFIETRERKIWIRISYRNE